MAINSVIASYYYLRVIVVMYMRDPQSEPESAATLRFPITVNIVLAITAIATVYFGLAPNQILKFILQPSLIGNLR
jgi:NADH-quinone oxidoreductase subunit N